MGEIMRTKNRIRWMFVRKWPLLLLFVLVPAVPIPVFAQGTAGLPVPPAGFDQRKSGAPQCTVASISYQTTSYGMQKARIYTPPGYSTATK